MQNQQKRGVRKADDNQFDYNVFGVRAPRLGTARRSSRWSPGPWSARPRFRWSHFALRGFTGSGLPTRRLLHESSTWDIGA